MKIRAPWKIIAAKKLQLFTLIGLLAFLFWVRHIFWYSFVKNSSSKFRTSNEQQRSINYKSKPTEYKYVPTNQQPYYDHLAIGHTERQQLVTYLSHSDQIDNSTASYKGHHITVSGVNLTTINGLPAIVITFYDDVTQLTPSTAATRMRGGNSFRALYKGKKHFQTCAYFDHADDTYDVICRLYDACADVTIHVTYVDYGAYRWDGVFVNKLVWSNTVCVESPVSNAVLNFTNSKKTAHERWLIKKENDLAELRWLSTPLWNWTDTSRTYYAGWFIDFSGVHWLSRNGQKLPTDQQMKECLNALPSPIEFIGDSQLRFAFNDLLPRIDEIDNSLKDSFTLGKLKTHFVLGKYMFHYAGYYVDHTVDSNLMNDARGVIPRYRGKINGNWTIPDNPQNLHEELQLWAERERERASNLSLATSALKERRRLIVAFGTWDTMRINIKYFVSKGLPTVRTFLEARRADPVLSRVKIVFATIPAGPEHAFKDMKFPNSTVHDCLRNNAALAAVNRMLMDIIQSFDDVSVADWFGMTVHRTVQAYDDIHYVRQLEPIPLLSNTGIEMTRLLIDNVCA